MKLTPTDLKRHSRDCRVCAHPLREEIEREFCAWRSPSRIAKTYRVNRSTIYLHAAAAGLMATREKNVKAALSAFIERCARVRPSAAALVSACVALSKLNAEGQTIDRVSLSSLNHAFDRFTRGELEKFAVSGELPAWYLEAVSETRNGPGGRAQ